MRAMTFNLRFDNEADGENAWVRRRELVARVICGYAPAIVGTQEGTVGQLDYLGGHLAGYRLFAPDRVWDDTCQYPTLFYREDIFLPVEGAEFWLSETPEVHRSKSWDSAFPRMISYGLFKDLRNGNRLWAAVTHLDNIGVDARIRQARVIDGWIERHSNGCILMGDFNDSPGSAAHRLLTTRLRDSWQAMGRGEDENSMTYHMFSGFPRVARMDWILVSHDFMVKEYRIVHDHDGVRYPSDHFPCFADLDCV